MANLAETVNYDTGVYQLETTDPVQGGSAGISNAQAKNLANRTAYLKQHLDNLESGATIPPGIARVNSETFTGSPTVPTAALGNRSLNISNTTFVQDTVHGTTFKSVAGSSNVTLTAIEAGVGVLVLTGALTGNIDVIVPSTSHTYIVDNRTSGAFTLRVKTAAGAGVFIKQGKRQEVFCDATDVLQSTTDFTDTALVGTPTAPAATIGDNSTQVVNTSMLQNTIGGVVSVAVGGSSNVTLTQPQWGYGIILLTGVLTGNINVILPTQNDQWIICNQTTGNFTITLKTAAGTGALVRQSESVVAYCDGTNIALAGSTPAATFTEFPFTATAGQTVFSCSYTPGNIIVTRNGAMLAEADYTATNATSVTLASAAALNDKVVVLAFSSLVIANALTQTSGDARYPLKANGTSTGLSTFDQILYKNSLGVKTTLTASSATTTLQLVLADTFKVTIGANTTFVFDITSVNPGTNVFSFSLITVNDSTAGRAVAFPASVQWAGGQIPPRTTAANAKDVWTFYTEDGGTTWGGSLSIADQK